jgi:class 3 adenylate cyclase
VARLRQTLGGRSGRPLTHSSYTTTGDTTPAAGMAHLDAMRHAQGLPPLPFGAALHLGEMLWGNIGAADRLDFTAIGPAVNLVSRLEGLCRPLGRWVLISGAVAAETTTKLVRLGEHVLRGVHAAGWVRGPVVGRRG